MFCFTQKFTKVGIFLHYTSVCIGAMVKKFLPQKPFGTGSPTLHRVRHAAHDQNVAAISSNLPHHQNSIRYRSLAFMVEAAIVGGTVEHAVVAGTIQINNYPSIHQPKSPKRNYTFRAILNTILHDNAVFHLLNLFAAFLFTSHFKSIIAYLKITYR